MFFIALGVAIENHQKEDNRRKDRLGRAVALSPPTKKENPTKAFPWVFTF